MACELLVLPAPPAQRLNTRLREICRVRLSLFTFVLLLIVAAEGASVRRCRCADSSGDQDAR
jgi:hypothetical protein